MRRRTVLAGAGTVLTGALSGCGEFDDLGGPTTESVFQEYDISPETRVAISNRNGGVTVAAADGDRLRVLGEKQAGSQSGLDSIGIEVVEGERFLVNVNFASGSEFESRSVDLTVELPAGVSVDTVSTANGPVAVRGVRGDVSAVTANGTVEVANVSGYVRCESGNGDIGTRNTTGMLGA